MKKTDLLKNTEYSELFIRYYDLLGFGHKRKAQDVKKKMDELEKVLVGSK